MALVKISMCSFLSANAPEVGLEHFWKWTFCTVVKKEWVSAVDQKQNSKRCSVRNFSNCYTWVNSHLMQGHAISFWFIYRKGENATELQPGWNSISKRSVVGAGEFVSVSQMAGLDTKASPWPQEWLKLQTFFRSPWHVPKPWQGGPLRGAAVVTREPAPGWPLCPTAAAVSRCYFLTQTANSSLDSITKL